MMTQEQLQQLKKVIQEANPELMEMAPGCRVRHIWLKKDGTIVRGSVKGQCYVVSDGLISADRCPVETLEIIGHPIQLHHVLLAIDEEIIEQDEVYVIDSTGNFYEIEPSILPDTSFFDYPFMANWQLTKDFDHQSDECKQFLFDILVKE